MPYTRHTEKFAAFLYPGALLIAAELLIGATFMKRIP